MMERIVLLTFVGLAIEMAGLFTNHYGLAAAGAGWMMGQAILALLEAKG